MEELPTLKQALVIHAFKKASQECQGVQGVEPELITKRSACIRERLPKTLEELEALSEEEKKRIHKQVFEEIER